MFNVFSVVPATRRAVFVLALLLTAGAMVALPTRALADTTISTVSCNGNNLVIATQHAANSFGSYQLFGNGPGMLASAPDQNSGNQNQGVQYANDGTVTVDGPGNWTDLTVWQANGFSYDQKDTIGNVTCPAGFVEPAPVLSLPPNITVEATGPSGAAVTFTASATDANPSNPAVTCNPASGSTFALGTTTVNCSATDAASNTTSGSFKVTVQDTTPPKLTLPANITVPATGPTGAVVNFVPMPTAIDLVDGSRPVTCTPASGSTFAITTTTVNCSAADKTGNTASGSFTVTVEGPSTLAAQLITDSTGAAPGTALADQATAIQTAVNAKQTATACADITDYLALVKAQTGKKISKSTAKMLTDAADSLSAALGCT